MKRFFFLLSLLISISIGQVWATEYELMLTLDVTKGAPSGTTSTALTDATLLSYLQGAASAATDITAASKVSGDVYKGKGSGGGSIPQACLKIGKASGGGSISFTIASTYDDVTKVEITGYCWKTSTSVSVNSSDAQTTTNAQSQVTFPYEISATKTISIAVTSSAFCATEIKLYKTKSGGGDVIVKTLESIAVEGMTTSYETGDAFSFDGTCTATYSVTKNDEPQADESKTVTPTSVSSPDMSTAGEKTITVSFTDGNITKETTYDINVVAATKSSLIFSAACGGSGTADDGAKWTVTSDAAESNFDTDRGIHYGTNKAAVSYLQLVTNSIHGTIKKVVVNTSGASGTSAVISVKVGKTDFTISGNNTTSPILATAADYTFTGSESGQILVNISQTSNTKAIYCKSIVVTYESNGKGEADLAYDEEDQKQLIKLGNELAVPALGNPHNLDVTYASSNTNVAEVDAEDGTVTIKAAGVAVITASFDGNDNYNEGSASYTIGATTHAGTKVDPYDVADAKIVIDVLGTQENAYVSGIISQVDEYLSNYKSITYWISDDGETSDQLKVYSGKGIDGADFSSVNDVALKDLVVVKGTLKLHNSTYEFDYNNQLVSLEKPAVPTVTLKQSGTIVTELNAEATDVANQAIDIESTNFANTISSVTARLYSESACENEVTSGAWVTDITINAAKDKVTFNIADNASDARQVWMKVTASDGTNQASAVLAISQARYSVDYATLPFTFVGGRADIESTNGMTQNGLGTDYSNVTTKLKFDGSGDYVIIKINAAPGTLSYDIKGNSFSGGTFKVQESVDGTSYSDLATYTEDGNGVKHSLASTTRYIKFVYAEKTNGNIGLGNIAISAYVAPVVKPTITTQPEGAGYTQNATANALSIVAEAGNSGTLSYQWYRNNANSTEGAEAIENATDDEYTPSTESIGTVYYYCVVTEAGADATTTSDIVAVIVTAAPESTGTFELFSGELTEGDYLITHDSEVALKCEINSDRFAALEVSASENKITNPDASIIWHIAQSGEYWTIYNVAAEKYAASTGAKNKGALLDAGSDDKALWSVSGSEFVNKQNTANSVNATLRYNSQNALNTSWACYATSTGETPTLYKKKVAGQPKTPTFTVAGGTYTSVQTVGIECATVGATIYYTIDGSVPSDASTVYSEALTISSTTTVKAIAIMNALASDVTSATYKIVAIAHEGTADDPYTVADARNAIDVDGDLSDKYVSGIISQVDSYNSTYKSITYWISDDGETTSPQLEVYSGKGLDGADFSSKDDLQTGDIVVINGTLKLYESTYEFDKNNQLVSYAKPNVPTVTLKQSDVIVTELNVVATEVANQVIDVECANFASAISSVNAKLYEESTCETEITSGAWVTDITVNGAKDQLTFNIADNTGDARQVWMKVTASDGTNEASAVLAISQAKSAFATLPFAFDGGKADIANAGGMSHSGLGSDYSASPKLKFDNTGDWLIIKINEAPGKLTYDIKNNSFADGTFTVQESADGETYTEVASHIEIVNTQNEKVDLKQATRYVKFIYTEKSSGNVGLGNITISKYENPDPEPPTPDYGSYQRPGLTVGYYGTICLPNAGTIANAKLFDLEYYDGENTLYLLEVNGNAMEAGHPYVFLPSATSIEVTYTDNAGASAGSFNGLVGSYTQETITADAGNYILYNNMYYLVNSTAYVGANRAYIHMAGVPTEPSTPQVGQAPRRRVAMNVNGRQVATGISDIETGDQPIKVMIDGNLYIIRAGQMYDMTGSKVK